MESSFRAHVTAISFAARDINIYEFTRSDGGPLADVEPALTSILRCQRKCPPIFVDIRQVVPQIVTPSQ